MAVAAALVAGLLAGVAITLVVRIRRPARPARPAAESARRGPRVGPPVDPLLQILSTAVVRVDANGDVRSANAAARDLGLVQGRRLCVDALERLTRDARLHHEVRVRELSIDVGSLPRRETTVRAAAHPLDGGDVGLLVDDLAEAARVESMRRDFVANVGHEIKTPVGALSLLADAALDAADEPDAVQRFLRRIQHEASRLSRLVQELLDLSRLQGGDPPGEEAVALDAVVEEAIDRTRAAADAKDIALVSGGDSGVTVVGSERQLVTALANLLDNAIAYSASGTIVAVGVKAREHDVEVAVKDEGIGIAAVDQARIFERFYRVDPARSRDTGGTGLGLAIVKHIAINHGGDVSVWSEPGSGSTFTLRLPLPADERIDDDVPEHLQAATR